MKSKKVNLKYQLCVTLVSLRPYMHNGVFRDLKTVLLFKDSFNNPNRKVNPETGKAWDKAEYAQTINPDVLKAKPLTDEEINALEAFLKTLTDEAYEE